MTVRFPQWVDAHKKEDQRASARLRYLISVAAVEATGRQSVRGLCERIEMDHSSVSSAIRRGYFTEQMAKAIEAAVGRKVIRFEYLIAPLKIKAAA